MYKFVWLHVAFFEQVYVCVYVTLSVCVFVVNKVKIDLLLLVYICDAVIQNNNMFISNGKVFPFLIIFSDVVSESINICYSCLSHREKPTFITCGAKDGKLNWTKNVHNNESN